MKRLFLQVYILIMGSILVVLVANDYLNGIYYKREVEDEYLKKATMLTQAIQRDIALGSSEYDTIAWWRTRLRDNEMDLSLIKLEGRAVQPHLRKVAITEASDQLEVVIPFDAARAIKFTVDDHAEPGAMWTYYGGYAFLYLLLAGMIYALTYRLYRHIEVVREQAQRVAGGDYDWAPSPPPTKAFAELHDDLLSMTRALAEKTQENHLLTAAIHHELRTPLTRLRLALDIALQSGQKQQVDELMHEMDDALTALTHLMNDILTLSRLRLAQQAPPREPIALHGLIDQCICRLANDHIQATLAPCQVFANRALLERALSNLLDNACKYARERVAVVLTVTGADIELEISDDGPGIPEALRSMVLHPFVRLDKHRNRSVGGSGLGLAIADLALKDSGATWAISDSRWGGTSIRVWWQQNGDIS
ncbi:sensor histidine kinase [Pseudoduganella sp. HUAS MS19]